MTIKSILFVLVILSHFSVSSQTDSLVQGKYTYIEEIGVDYYYDGAGGIVASGADTTLTYKISLANDYSATLQIDTMIGIFSGFHPEYTWLGIWSKNNDTLYIEFTQFSTLYPFTFNGEKPKPELEELPNSIIKKFIIGLDYQGKEIYSLTEIREDDDLIVYR